MITLSTIIFSVLACMSLWIAWTLALIKNGSFRKIMIGYFLSEAWMLLAIILIEYIWGADIPLAAQLILLLGAFPKFIFKILFYNFTNKK